MALSSSAYDAAARTRLALVQPLELRGLKNVFRLSSQILSGSEPHGQLAFHELALRGVKTILSVDGSRPDVETAELFGMRYVHVPIQYSGIREDELLRIVKTFRELEGPFYVHCFHGRHRGPAAAAVGRCVLDGAPRGRAIAEMRQWMGTSKNYEGLYRTIATIPLPSDATTADYDYDFPSVQEIKGFAAGMSTAVRARDNLKILAERDFGADPAHPDVDPKNETEKLLASLLACRDTVDYETGESDFRGWLDESIDDSRELLDLFGAEPTSVPVEKATAVFRRIRNTCNACHAAYRN